MCHWILRVWQCGDSFFTKYSSCSFDRAAHSPNNPLNPLHPSITPFAEEGGGLTPSKTGDTKSSAVGSPGTKGDVREATKTKHTCKSKATTRTQSQGLLYQPATATINDSTPKDAHHALGSNGAETAYSRDGGTGYRRSILPLSELGRASRFGDQTLVESSQKCQVFEVVLQSKESTICPSCARSPRRAALPAHARGCFGLS